MSNLKMTVLGARGVGKTTLVKNFTRNIRPERNLGGNVYKFNNPVGRGRYQSLTIVDTFNSFLGRMFKRDIPHQIKHGDAFVIVYSVDDPKSYCEAMDLCLLVYKLKGSVDVPLVIVGNKADLPYKVDLFRVSQLGDLPHINATSRSGYKVRYVFDLLLHINQVEQRRLEMQRVA